MNTGRRSIFVKLVTLMLLISSASIMVAGIAGRSDGRSAPQTRQITNSPLQSTWFSRWMAEAEMLDTLEATASTKEPQQFGDSANFPEVELVHYEEKVGQVPLTQLFSATATITIRVVNNGKAATDPVTISVKDSNVLMKQVETPQKIKALKPGENSGVLTLHLTAILPPAKSQLPGEQQFSEWQKEYQERCGVDLRVVLDWAGPKAQAPMTDHREDYLYLGYGNSKPWQEGRPVPDTIICDDKNCTSLNGVNRSIYKQLACKVVGYASFVGDRVNGSHAIFNAYGKARTSANPPEADFTPNTKMQIASTSKVLTALAAIKTLETPTRLRSKPMDSFAYTFFPSDWTLPSNSIVKQITFREFLSQTSGVKQYYASAKGQDFNSLKQFFTQTISNPNAQATCPGSCPPSSNPKQKCGPATIPNPIVSNKAPCYTDTNFGIMRILLPRVAGATTNDPQQLAEQYVKIVQDKVFAPVGVQNVACKPPAPGNNAFLYTYPGTEYGGDWGDLTLVCGDWGWYVSVEDYARVLVSLNSGDHKILTDCQFYDMETNPSNHPVGWDITGDGLGHRWLEKNGGEGICDAKGNCGTQTTSVGIFGGRSACGGGVSPMSGVAGVLFINSDISGRPNVGADQVLIKAFQDATKPKP